MRKKGSNRHKTIFFLFLVFIAGFLLSSNYTKIIGMVTAIPTILNPGFELGSGADASYWLEGTNHIRTSDRFYSGAYSLKATYSTATITGAATKSDPIAVTPGAIYVLSGYFYNILTQGNAYLDLSDIVGDCHATSQRDTPSWQYASCEVTIPSTISSVRIRFVTDLTPVGTVWLDGVSLMPKELTTTTTTTTTITTTTTTLPGPTDVIISGVNTLDVLKVEDTRIKTCQWEKVNYGIAINTEFIPRCDVNCPGWWYYSFGVPEGKEYTDAKVIKIGVSSPNANKIRINDVECHSGGGYGLIDLSNCITNLAIGTNTLAVYRSGGNEIYQRLVVEAEVLPANC